MKLQRSLSIAAGLQATFDPVAFQSLELAEMLPQLDDWQAEACRIRKPGVLMLCGRQTGKSTFAALIAVWKITKWPNQLVLLISPTLRQSSELFRKATVLFDSVAGAPKTKSRTKTEITLANGSTIVSLPGANPDAIRGYSAPDVIIEDEAAFVNDRTFTASRPMLATSDHGRHILLTTPYGRRGHFYDLWMSDDPDWQRITMRSKECDRISPRFLEGERRVLSERAYAQEYECKFLEAANAVFPADLIERLTDHEERRVVMPDETGKAADHLPPGEELEAGLAKILTTTDKYAAIG